MTFYYSIKRVKSLKFQYVMFVFPPLMLTKTKQNTHNKQNKTNHKNAARH